MTDQVTDSPLGFDESQAKFDLLKLELTIIAGKAKDAVDNLWRIRVYTYTFWIACVGASLVGLSLKVDAPAKPDVIWPLLWFSFLPPLVSVFVDAGYHAWYRLAVLREDEIGKFLNELPYTLPKREGKSIAAGLLAERIFLFPIYDLSGERTFEKSKKWLWEKSMVRNLASPTPLLIYASQLFGSAALVFSFSKVCLMVRIAPALAVLVAIVLLEIARGIMKVE